MSGSGEALLKSPADTPADLVATIGGENRKIMDLCGGFPSA
jgi:hypothetical protein